MPSKTKKRKYACLTPEQWRAIRQIWEFDPDEPTYVDAIARAVKKHSFYPPSRIAVCKRAKREKWERRGSLAGINQAAHRIADRLGDDEEGKKKKKGGWTQYNEQGVRPDSPIAEREERHEAEIKRAEIRARHRREWEQVAILRQEALKHRKEDPDQAFHRLKITKIAAESTAI